MDGGTSKGNAVYMLTNINVERYSMNHLKYADNTVMIAENK